MFAGEFALALAELLSVRIAWSPGILLPGFVQNALPVITSAKLMFVVRPGHRFSSRTLCCHEGAGMERAVKKGVLLSKKLYKMLC